jgi:hypothetical protein
MSTSIDTNFAKQYSPMLTELSQQRVSVLKDKVIVKQVDSAEEWFMDQYGAVSDTEVTGQRQTISLSNTPHYRRMISKRSFYFADTIEERDLTNMLVNPQAAYTKNGLQALERRLDSLIIEAAFATAYTGKLGTTTKTFAADGGTTIATGAAGLTFAKFLTIRKTFQNNNVHAKRINLVIGPEQEEDLYGISQFMQREYRSDSTPIDNMSQMDNYIGRFMEFDIWRSTLLAVDTGTRDCLAWVEGGLGLITGIAPKVILGVRDDMIGAPLQVQVLVSAGASRLDGQKVIKVQCAE